MGRDTSAAQCLKCGGPTTVRDARLSEYGAVRRRRVCQDEACGYRFSTLEILYGPHPRAIEIARWAAEQNRDIFLEDE